MEVQETSIMDGWMAGWLAGWVDLWIGGWIANSRAALHCRKTERPVPDIE